MTQARVLILDHKGSAPRGAGTVMLVGQDDITGTIGGGALEYEVIKRARKVIKSGQAEVATFPLGPALGQCCGGSVRIAIEPNPAKISIPRRLTGNADKPLSISRAEAQIRNASFDKTHLFDSGWLIEAPVPTPRQIWIYGAGHVGRAIVECLDGLGMDIIWVDTAQSRFPENPRATTLMAQNPADAAKHAPAMAEHIVLTYSHEMDLALCHQILGQDHRSLRVIGSATKRRRFEKRLADLGHNQAKIDQMICPIGDPTLGKEPKAIAIGIASTLISAGSKAALSTPKLQTGA